MGTSLTVAATKIHFALPQVPSCTTQPRDTAFRNAVSRVTLITQRTPDKTSYTFFPMAQQPQWARASSLPRLHHHSQRHTTLSRTPSARRRDFYVTTHNTHKRQTSMPPPRFEPAIPASERPQIHALDRAATGIGDVFCYLRK
jgi:hypothetical protein